MCRKLIYLISFVLVFSLAGSASAATVYNYFWTNNNNNRLWNQLSADPNYNWERIPSWTTNPNYLEACGPPEALTGGDTSGQIWLIQDATDPNARISCDSNCQLMPVTIPAGYDANCGGKADEFQTIYGPDWGMHLDIYGKLGIRYNIASAQWQEGLFDPCNPDDDPNRSVINMYSGSEIYGPNDGRCSHLCLGLGWWMAYPYVTFNMYGDSVARFSNLLMGGHINLYGGTFDMASDGYVNMGTRDSWVVPDELIRINIEEGTLILPGFYDAAAVQGWIDRGIVKAYGETPGQPRGPSIIIDTEVNPGRTTVTASPTPPSEASEPNPADGATDVDRTPTLTWMPGRYADKHDVYFGTDETKVTDANRTNPLGVLVSENQDANTYDPCGLLERNQTYYWRIDEVNMAEDPNIWKGDVWSFTTADYIKIDNFDLYSTRDDLVTAWKDGYASYPTPTSGSNITLSTEIDEGYGDPSPGPIHEGRNAMQFVYDNDGLVTHYEPDKWPESYYAPYYSEIEANISDLPTLSDWTTDGVKALALSFFGRLNNDVDDVNEQMYVVVEDGTGAEAIAKYGDDTNEDVNNLRKPKWQQWNIDLTEFSDGGVDLNDVNKVYIGFGNRDNPAPGGYGIVYFDSIRLYRPRCVPGTIPGDFTDDCVVDYNDLAIFVEVWLSQPESVGPNVVGQWKFDGASGTEATDSVGGNHGTILGGAALDGSGQLTLDGEDDYVELPIGSVIASLNECSFVAWVDWPGTGGDWQRIFDIGHPNEVDPCDPGASTNPQKYVFLTPSPFRCAITIEGLGEPPEQIAHGIPDPMPSGLHCVVVTIDVNDVNENNTILSLYLDGELAGRNTDANLAPSDLGETPNNWLGRSLYAVDPYISGSYDEFRIYDRVLPEGEIELMYYSTIVRQRSDVSGDGKVDFRDFAMLADKWLEGPILWP